MEAEAVLVAAAVPAGLLVAVLALRQPLRVAAFEQVRLSGVRTSLAEVSAE
jgi:hypothetical protein